MAIKFQYNKTALQNLNKQLNMRLKALPVIKNKETALRMEVKLAKKRVNELDIEIARKTEAYSLNSGIWIEFDKNLISINEVKTTVKKIAGVKTPVLENVVFQTSDFSIFNNPKWFSEGISMIKELAEIVVEREIYNRKMELLNYARRKTTQKVNLYEKVQIPGYENAISKIKRFLEDEENLSKSSQKIVKNRKHQQTEASQ